MNGVVMNSQAHKNQRPTAAEACYQERLTQCRDLQSRIGQRLDDHQQDKQKTPNRWTHAGDLGHAAQELAQLLAFLGDRSAVDEMGLEC